MRLALYGAGAVSKSFIAGLPRLPRQLGPVAASSYRLASRIVNSVRAGFAVKSLEGFEDEQLILICVPDPALAGVVRHLAAARLDWFGREVLLCDSHYDSRALDPLREQGAETGSLKPIHSAPGRFIVEGDRAVVRKAKHLLTELKARCVEFRREDMPLYGAGVTFASSIFTPLIAACLECVTSACGDPAAAMRITEALFQDSLRAFVHAGRKSWSGALASGDRAVVKRELEALCASRPVLSRYYRDSSIFALEWFGRHPELLRQLHEAALPGRRRSSH